MQFNQLENKLKLLVKEVLTIVVCKKKTFLQVFFFLKKKSFLCRSMGSAIAQFTSNAVKGIVRFTQLQSENALVEVIQFFNPFC